VWNSWDGAPLRAFLGSNQRTILLRSEVAGKKCLSIGRVELLEIADI
jgi:hypothetical protein